MSSKNTKSKSTTPLKIPSQKIYRITTPKITITSIAKSLGISQSYLSLLINGQRHLNPNNPFHRSIHNKLISL